MNGLQWATFVISAIGTACWAICFWWMHRISVRQDNLLFELHDVTRRIEELTREEHDLIREVHPGVEEIKQSLEQVTDGSRSGTRRG